MNHGTKKVENHCARQSTAWCKNKLTSGQKMWHWRCNITCFY